MAFKLKSGNTTNFKSMGSSPAKNKPTNSHKHNADGSHKATETRTKTSVTKTKGNKSSTYNVTNTEDRRDGSKIITLTNDLGNSYKELHSSSKKSPAKQYSAGGTKSGKGNIFTKRGRKQRKLNKHAAELAFENYAFNQAKIKREAEKEKSPAKQGYTPISKEDSKPKKTNRDGPPGTREEIAAKRAKGLVWTSAGWKGTGAIKTEPHHKKDEKDKRGEDPHKDKGKGYNPPPKKYKPAKD